jgi:hypothetical protein
MKFKIVIEETVAQEFEVEAENQKEALQQAEQNYSSGKLVLEPGEVQSKKMAVVDEKIDELEWVEF